jgi:lycopene cyclase CruA
VRPHTGLPEASLFIRGFMVATAPTKYVARFDARREDCAPDLSHFRRKYPETVAGLGAVPAREEWLRRIWAVERRWQKVFEMRGGESLHDEAIVRARPPAGRVAEAEFDVIYAGGDVALLNAAALAFAHGARVLVFDDGARSQSAGDWNLSDEDLRALCESGVFAREEVEAAVTNRRRGGFVKFHDAASHVKAGSLWVTGSLDVTVDGRRLLALASERLKARKGCAVQDGLRFVRAYVEPARVTVEVEGQNNSRRLFAARLFVDASGADSCVARQLAGGLAPTHLCPTVGTVARGFARGEGARAVDFGAGEILVSTEDAGEHRQLFWEGFGASASRDEYATRLFFYDTLDSPADKSLLSLFERYFESLASYKRKGGAWRVERPVFGYFPADGRARRSPLCDDRVMLMGEAARGAGALASRGFGAHVRTLGRAAKLTHLALEADISDADSLSRIAACGAPARVTQAVGLAEFMRPAAKGEPSAVNETLNALLAALGGLDERVRRELFQGRLSFTALRTLLTRTARLYPRIFARVRERFGARGTLVWLAGVAEALWSERRGASAEDARVDVKGGGDAASEFRRLAALRGGE